MFKVYWTDKFNVCRGYETEEMSQALAFAEHLRKDDERFVVMVQENVNQVGGMGVDAVADGLLPNGDKYEWMKRRSQ